MQRDPEATTRSAPESPVIGLTENPFVVCQDASISGSSKELNPEAPKLNPSIVIEDTSTTAGISGDKAEGSTNPGLLKSSLMIYCCL